MKSKKIITEIKVDKEIFDILKAYSEYTGKDEKEVMGKLLEETVLFIML